MKPSDLRRDAYTWSQIAENASIRADLMNEEALTHRELLTASNRFEDAATALHKAVEAMNRAADELEARNAS